MSVASDMVALYLAAEAAVLKGQSFRLGDRSVTRSDLESIRSGRREWELRVSSEAHQAAGAGRDRRRYADFSGECS